MPTRLTPHLTLAGNAREVMDFYHHVFGGALVRSTYGELGNPEDEWADRVMHSELETTSGMVLVASDAPPGVEPPVRNAVVLSLSGENPPELRGYWERLVAGGTVTVPLEPQAWGDEFGICVDRFGVSWLVNIVASPA